MCIRDSCLCCFDAKDLTEFISVGDHNWGDQRQVLGANELWIEGDQRIASLYLLLALNMNLEAFATELNSCLLYTSRCV